MTTQTIEKPKQKRGLACLSPEKRSEIARKGGRAAQTSGNAHHWTSETAQEASKKGLTVRRLRMRERAHKEAQ